MPTRLAAEQAVVPGHGIRKGRSLAPYALAELGQLPTCQPSQSWGGNRLIHWMLSLAPQLDQRAPGAGIYPGFPPTRQDRGLRDYLQFLCSWGECEPLNQIGGRG